MAFRVFELKPIMMIKKIVKKIIPKKHLLLLVEKCLFIKTFMFRMIYRGSRYSCSFCNHSFSRFLPSGFKLNVLKEKKIIGGGYRLNATCPYCSSSDRDRLVHLFLKEHKLLYRHMRLLHVAPERSLQKLFERKDIEYFSADLKSYFAEIKMDLKNIKYPANYFDAIICNHVLEHIVDDKKAMRELYRVLKPGGWAILQVPYSPVLKKTFEDSSISRPKERKMVFGQLSHVRIYGTDYINRLQSVGFQAKQENLDKNATKKFALNPNEMIFFCKK